MVVLMENMQAFHVTASSISMTSAVQFLLSKSEPLVIRPALTSAQRKYFLDRLTKLYDAKYEYARALRKPTEKHLTNSSN